MVGGVHYKLVRESAYDGISDVSVDNSINPSNSKNGKRCSFDMAGNEPWNATKKRRKSKTGLVPGYTTLSVRVRANIQFGAFKIKSVRTKTDFLGGSCWSAYRITYSQTHFFQIQSFRPCAE